MPNDTDQPTLAVTQADRAVHVRENLDAYYYSFEATGDADIDRILGAVAYAGKAYHHTEDWDDESVIGVSCVGNIQNAANLAARHRTIHEPRPAGDLREAAQFLSDRLDDLEWMDGELESTCRDYMGHVDPAHDRLKSALATHSPAPMAGEQEVLARAIDRMGWAEIHAYQAELRKGQDIHEDAGGYFLRAIRALFGIKQTDTITTYQDAARALVAAAHPSTQEGGDRG